MNRLARYLQALLYLPVHTRHHLEEIGQRDRQREEQINSLHKEVETLRSELAATREALQVAVEGIYPVLNRNYFAVTDNAALAQRRDAAAREVLGRIETRQAFGVLGAGRGPLAEHEFQVFSQFGEDGILQWLTHVVPLPSRRFIEFGVEDYRQANTRLLALQDRWTGLVLDGGAEYIAAIRQDELYAWRDLTVAEAFITAENINDLLIRHGFTGEIGVLSIDVDGNDYWIWEAITAVRPAIVVIEYNYRFGPTDRTSVPYDPAFVKTEAHSSAIYFGASLAALCDLSIRKGYAFVGCSSGGVNAFFVRRDLLPESVRELSPEEGYVAGQHDEFRDENGAIIAMPLTEQRDLLYRMPLVRFESVKS